MAVSAIPFLVDPLQLINLHLSPNEFLLTFDGKSRVVSLFPKHRQAREWTSFNFYGEILKGKPIGRYYGLSGPVKPPDALDLADPSGLTEKLFSPPGPYLSRNRFESYHLFFEFYSNLPSSRLYPGRLKGGGRFGIVRLSPLAVACYHYRAMPLVVLDSAGALRAVNRSFLDFFGDRDASRFLGRPVTEYIRPSPLEGLTGKPGDFSSLLNEPWMENFRSGARNSTPGFLPVGAALDLSRDDFKITCGLRSLQGRWPSFIFNGAADTERFFPDFSGYLLGPDPFAPNIQLKKEGHVVHRVQLPGPAPGKSQALTLVKRGFSIAFFLDEKLLLGYRDPEPLSDRESRQYLYFRDGDAAGIESLSLSTLPNARTLQSGFNEAFFTGGRENAFRFQPLADDVVTRESEMLYPFVFYDITSLKRNIALLQRSRARVERERDRYKALALGDADALSFVGEHPALVSIKKEASKAAATGITVLIEGETGTGKEVLARFVHAQSAYKDGPFVKVDCSTIPESLLESELFGAEKGAFTGAVESRGGKLEAAAGGTLFLDELSNLNGATQAKFLEFLQDNTLTRLGSTRKIKVDCRVVGASNVPLKTLVDQGRFRPDLYYRLGAVRFRLPALQARREDMTALCSHFLKIFNEKFEKAVKGFSPAGFKKLLSHHWPGNIRELENTIQNAVLFCDGDVIEPAHVRLQPAPDPPSAAADDGIPRGDARALRREHIVMLLEKHNQIIDRAARDARVSRMTVFRKMRKFGLKAGAGA